MGRGRHPITGRPYKSGTKIPDQTLKEALGIGGDSKNKQAGKKNKEGRHPITGTVKRQCMRDPGKIRYKWKPVRHVL